MASFEAALRAIDGTDDLAMRAEGESPLHFRDNVLCYYVPSSPTSGCRAYVYSEWVYKDWKVVAVGDL